MRGARGRSPRSCGPSLATVRAAAQGNRPALERVLSALYTPVFDFLMARFDFAHDPEDVCQDLAQETLLRIARGLAGCRAESEEQFLVWVLTVARNVGLNHVQRLQVEVTLLAGNSDAGETLTPGPWGETDDAPHGEGDRIVFRLLTEVIEQLPDSASHLLWAHLVDGLPWSLVAEQVGTTADGAKRRFQRLQERLRREMLRRIASLPDPDRRKVLGRLGCSPPPEADSSPAPRTRVSSPPSPSNQGSGVGDNCL